jgi:hypothetical protein
MLLVSAAALVAVILLPSCGEKVTPEQRLEAARYNHEIIPVAAKTLYDAEGAPTLLIDLQVINQGGVALEHLTVLVQVFGPDGEEKTSQRVTLDLSGVRPGIGARVSALLPGVELLESVPSGCSASGEARRYRRDQVTPAPSAQALFGLLRSAGVPRTA